MFEISKKFHISASHAHSNPKIACSRMHGHNYQMEIVVGSKKLNDEGMVMDFSELKKIIREEIQPFDHKHIGRLPVGWKGNAEHVMDFPFSEVTAENLAYFFGNKVITRLPEGISLIRFIIKETENNTATWIPEHDR